MLASKMMRPGAKGLVTTRVSTRTKSAKSGKVRESETTVRG